MAATSTPQHVRWIGSDEAGYGPTIGPLVVATVALSSDDERQSLSDRLRELGCDDSKKVYAGKNLARLEGIALAGLAHGLGWTPSSAHELWQMLGDPEPDPSDEPWRSVEIPLPIAATIIPAWQLPASDLKVSMVHAQHLNAARQEGQNRHEVEAEALLTHWRAMHSDQAQPLHALCDRLGGRRHYHDLLQRCWPEASIGEAETIPGGCLHRVVFGGQQHSWRFCTKADANDGLCGLASCIAKYCREVAMRQFNTYWCSRLRSLKPTAGYPADAKRFRFQLGSGLFSAFSDRFWRFSADEIETHNET